jgi:hypothetical protein
MNMKPASSQKERGSTLVVTIAVVATILTLLGAAVGYTQHVSRMSDRSRKIAQAMEVGDGHLEFLFTHWRNISRAPGLRYTLKQPATNFFFTTPDYNPGPAPTPWTTNPPYPNPWPGVPAPIPRPSVSLFPDVPNYQVTEYRIQAVTPMIDLDATGKSTLGVTEWPPPAYGPNQHQYSYFYLASVDVTIPALNGNVTAKVRRVFEKKYDNPWTFAVFYNDDLEMHPEDPLIIDGPVHTNSSLYVSTSNLIVQDSSNAVRPPSKVSYAAEYLNGFSPKDTSSRTTGISKPTFPPKLPPAQDSPYLPFSWNLKLTNEDGSVNNDSYHELIERPHASTADPLAEVRFYHQAGIKVLIDGSNNVRVFNASNTECFSNSSGNDKRIYDLMVTSVYTNRTVYDYREGGPVRVADLDINKLTVAIDNATIVGFNGVIYISDTSAVVHSNPSNVVRRGIRLINGWALPQGKAFNNAGNTNASGLTIVSENPVYIKGNYNTGGTSLGTSNPPSNTNPTSSPVVGTYGRKQAAVIADAVTVLSNNWQDSYNSGTNRPSRPAVSTTINCALVAGIVPSANGEYSGGVENFIRLLEDWNSNSRTFCYWGSMVQLYTSVQANAPWRGSGSIYKSPVNSRYYWDSDFGKDPSDGKPYYGSPPGKLQIAAYLQQQRWYQVY